MCMLCVCGACVRACMWASVCMCHSIPESERNSVAKMVIVTVPSICSDTDDIWINFF